jgi:hypothetical protein
VNYEDTCFFPMFKRFGGVKRLVKALDFRYAVILATLFAVMSGLLSSPKEIISSLGPILIPIGAALVAVIITGLAIIVSTSDDDFVRILKKLEIYENILFPFWLSAILSGVSVIINILSYIAISIKIPILSINTYQINLNNYIFTLLLWLAFLSTFYALFSVISLIENAIKYGLYRGEIKATISTLARENKDISNKK